MNESRAPLLLRFGSFAFSEVDARLTTGGRAVALTPKAFDLLAALLRNAGQLVTKDALLDEVWGHRHVSESLLKTTISELRAALGDDAKNPRWIETATRRGYRFIGTVECGDHAVTPGSGAAAAAAAAAASVASAASLLVGRESGSASLHACWARAIHGQRQLFFVAGEAGIGKTSLVDAFVATVGDAAAAHGQCIEQVGEGEPYLPVLEALAGLARADPSLIELLRRFAPTWLLQMPWLVEREERELLQASLARSTQDRMLREFSELVEQFTSVQPLLLVTEDLHWCDEATVRLIEHVARRRSPARLMWLATYRTPELVAGDHPLNGLRHELRARRLCEELLLDPFTELELAAYLALHRPEFAGDEAQVRWLHRQTGGLPLFVFNAVDELAVSGATDVRSDDWTVPDSLVGIIERQRGRAAPEVVALLEAAAVCGMEFEVAIVAAMSGRELAAVEAACETLARHQAWLGPAELVALPDGALDARFAFRHALYRQVIYQGIALPARAALHRRAAAAIERQHGDRLESYAAVLALHHERGLDTLNAMRAYAIAGERAIGRFAPREALLLAARGLALLAQAPEGEARSEAELALQNLRATSLGQSTGVSTAEARAAYRRCAELCERLQPTVQRAWIVSGLGWMFNAHGEYEEAEAIALHLRAAGDAFDDDLMRAAGAAAQAVALLQRGRVGDAVLLADEAHRLTQALGCPRLPPTVMHDPSTLALGVGAVAHAFRGDAGLAQRWSGQAVERARQLGQPIAIAFAGRCASVVDVCFGRADAAYAHAKRMNDLVREHEMGQAAGISQVLLGWARMRNADEMAERLQGVNETETGCAVHAASGTLFEATFLHRLAAEAALAVDDFDAARRHVDEGIAMVDRFGERLHLPDLWAVRAQLAVRERDLDGARVASESSVRLAREIGALPVELAARLALCELPGPSVADLEALREVRARWHDSTPWPVLARADALLEQAPRA